MTLDAAEAFNRVGAGGAVIGWKLETVSRRELLQLFPPRYANIIADHVTLKPRVSPDALLPGEVTCEIIGRADDDQGVEALVVRIDGSHDRPDGGTYHITWSLAEGRRPKESNDVIRDKGWQPFDLPQAAVIQPARF